jgi:VWFA-related protein
MTFPVHYRLILATLLFAPATPAQQSPAPQPPDVTFAVRTELVTIPVVVTDKKGQHLTGLKQSDFTVEENGHARQVATFEEISTAPGAFKPLPPSPYPFSNFAFVRQDPHRVIIIVLDLLNTSFFNQVNTREQLLKFLNAHIEDPNPMSLTVLTSKGLRVIHSFTNDPRILMAALKNVQSHFSAADQSAVANAGDMTAASTDAFDSAGAAVAHESSQLRLALAQRADASYAHLVQSDQTLITLYALQELAQSIAGIPGRKSVIWASGGLPLILTDPTSLAGVDLSFMSAYQATWRALNDANVAVYPIDAYGLVAPEVNMQAEISKNPLGGQFPGLNGRPSKVSIDPVQNRQDSLRAFADATGGKACLNRNDLDHCFALATEDSSQYYMLTYYLPADDRKPGWRKLKVKVGPPHGEIRARDQVYVGDNQPPDSKSIEHQFDLAFSSPMDYTAVPLGLKFTTVSPAENGARKVGFEVYLQPNAVVIDGDWVKFNVHMVATDAKDKSILVYSKMFHGHLKPEGTAQIAKEGIRYSGEMLLPPGRYQLKLLVRDDINGKFGTVQAPYLVN